MKKDYREDVTAIRGVGCICIIIYHFATAYSKYVNSIELKYFDFGWLTFAVPMFFVLSSMFLLKKAIEVNGPIKIIIYRMLRLMPAYILGVCFSSVLRIAIIKDTISLKMFVCNILMIEDVFGTGKIDGVYWTMEYEVFLLLIVSLASFVRIKGEKYLLGNPCSFCVCWLSLGTLSQTFLKIKGITSSTIQLILFASPYVPVFVCGILFYDLFIKKTKIYHMHIVCFIWASIYQLYFLPLATACIGIFATIIIYLTYMGYMRKIRIMQNRFFVWVGRVSFPLYLCHNQIGIAVCKKICSRNAIYDFFCLLSAGVFALIVAWMISIVEQYVINKVRTSSAYIKFFS